MIALAVALRPVRAGDAELGGLDPRERALLRPSAAPGRRAEFTAGRRAARAALARLLGPTAAGAAVVPEGGAPGGRPVPVDPRGVPLGAHLSITHAAGLAAAAAAPLPVGLDLVTLEPLDAAFCEEAFAAGELEGWEAWLGPAGGGARAACLAFAAKEAALKWLGTGMALPLLGVRVAPAGPGTPARLGGAVAARALPVRVETEAGAALVEGWVAGSPRRALVALCGEAMRLR